MEHFIWNIDPTILHLGPLQLRWYGLLFVGSFFLGAMILTKIFKREGKNPDSVENLLVYLMIGAVIGARLMHCFAYEPDFYLSHPLEILKVWKGGLASHGGLIGVLLALYFFTKKYNLAYFWLLSRVMIVSALSATFIRVGNFFNSEILGLPTDTSWAIIFSRIDMIPRHPVQLYEAGAYLLLFIILYKLYTKISPQFFTKFAPGLFFFYTFVARFFLEFLKTRQADYVTNLPFSTGQILSIPFIIIGFVWMLWAFKSLNAPETNK